MEACGVCKWFSHRQWTGRGFRRETVAAVVDVNLRVEAGQIYGLLGLNGSGKSTLIRMMTTLLLPDRGQIWIFAKDVVRDRATVRRWLGRVSAEAGFFKKLTARENLAYAAGLYGLPRERVWRDAQSLLKRWDMRPSQLEVPMEELSRGQQQKVAIARALTLASRVLFLDEPTTGLDPRARREVQETIRAANEEWGLTIFLSTHDLAEARRLCHRVAVLHQGRLVAEGPPAELLAGGEDPDSAFHRLIAELR
ncbi:MAG: ABC transporter ATP-binding protein [Firmicutes bacterium]|nr:ABC transporter ATP-binding protein [Alicyclobacillaceae bacterium]MCL6497857.1 ABC transporter ATP-binding protein [Bacillota bacterium]